MLISEHAVFPTKNLSMLRIKHYVMSGGNLIYVKCLFSVKKLPNYLNIC